MVTLKEIAQRANVSTTTVSNVINGKAKVSEENRQMILEIIKEMDYQPNYMAQGLRRQKSKIIGIIADDITMRTSVHVISGLMQVCEQEGYQTIIRNLRFYARWGNDWIQSPETYAEAVGGAIRELLAIKVDGLLFVASHARMINCFPKDLPVPMVMAYAYTDDLRVPQVVVGDESASYEMTKYLVSMGHRKIALVNGRADNIHAQKRALGFQRALFDCEVPCNPSWMLYGEWEGWRGYREMEKLADTGVTAVFCCADTMTAGINNYLTEHGKLVGTDISLVCFDDCEWLDLMYPGITCVEIPFEDMGRQAISLLLERIERPEEALCRPQVHEMPCRLIERRSVKKLP